MQRVKRKPGRIIKSIFMAILRLGRIILFKAIPWIASLAFMIIPFLYEFIPHIIAHGIWFPALAIYILDSLYEQKNTVNVLITESLSASYNEVPS